MNLPPAETHALIDALREELQEYGTFLQLLKTQQQSLLKRQPEEVLALSGSIETHLAVVGETRRLRRVEVQRLAGSMDATGDDTGAIRLGDLLPHFPASVAPMIRGLVEEINRLISQVSRFARQNQMLLARAVDSAQAVLQAARPGLAQKTYSPRGRVILNVAQQYSGATFCVA